MASRGRGRDWHFQGGLKAGNEIFMLAQFLQLTVSPAIKQSKWIVMNAFDRKASGNCHMQQLLENCVCPSTWENTHKQLNEQRREEEQEGNWNICNIMKINDPITHSFSYLPSLAYTLHKNCTLNAKRKKWASRSSWWGGGVSWMCKGDSKNYLHELSTPAKCSCKKNAPSSEC